MVAISVCLFEALMLAWQPGSTIRLDPRGGGFVVDPSRPEGSAPSFASDPPPVRPHLDDSAFTGVVYTIEGLAVSGWESFFTVIGEAVNGPGGYFGRSLDGLADCLNGGFGTPEQQFAFEWMRSAASRRQLGYAEAVRLLNRQPTSRERRARLLDAEWMRGPTPFDWIVSVFDSEKVPLRLS